MDEFTFDDDTKDVLTPASNKRQGRPEKEAKEKRKKCINTYLTDDEHIAFMAFLDGRPASIYLRKHILSKL